MKRIAILAVMTGLTLGLMPAGNAQAEDTPPPNAIVSEGNGAAVFIGYGGDKVVNRFGGSCSSCHAAADPTFDFICEHDHGCAPLPISDDVIRGIQQADPRPAGGPGSTDGTG